MSKNRKENWVYDQYARSPGGFGRGVKDGLNSYTLVWETRGYGRFNRHYGSDGQQGDWEKVGDDISSSMRKIRESA